MPKSAKIVLAILIATLLGGGGYFYLKLAKKPTEPLINIPPKTEEIDTSDWQTYRNETLGFEIKYPKTIARGIERIGPQPNIEDEFWRKQIGEVNFSQAAYVGTDGPQFRIMVKDTDYTMDGFGFRGEPDIIINNLPSRRRTGFPGENKSKIYSDFVLIRNSIRHYDIEFRSSTNPSKEEIDIWNTILSTFKPIQ